MTVAILGPGGVGGFLAAALQRAGTRTVVVAREDTAAHIARAGIAVESVRLGDFTARPRATARLTEPVEALIVATKAVGLEAALDRIEARPALVVPLLNGLDHMTPLRGRFGPAAVAAGTIRVESTRVAPGRIVQASPSLRIELAPATAAVRRLAGEILEPAGIEARVGDSEAQILWSKLVRLNVLALVTTAAGRPFGPLREDPRWARRIDAAARESSAVARAEGADIPYERVRAELDAVHPTLETSMQRDVAAGREPELDAIAGSVLRAGARHGVDTPEIAALYAEVAARAGLSPEPGGGPVPAAGPGG